MYFIAGPTESDCLHVIPCQNPSESLTICIILTMGDGWERPALISAYCVSLFQLNIKKMSEDERKSFWELMALVNCFAGKTFQGIVEG